MGGSPEEHKRAWVIAWKCLREFLPSQLTSSLCSIYFFLFLTSALVPSNIGIVRWINGSSYNEIGEIWLSLKLFKVLNIWGVGSKVNFNTDHMDTDRCSLEAPRGRSSLQVWDWALPAPPRDILLSRVCRSILCFPRSTQSPWSPGWLTGMTQAL